MKNSTILITGGLGFLGKEVVNNFLNTPTNTIRCLVRPGTDLKKASSELKHKNNPNLHFVQASFNAPLELRKSLEGVDQVIHLASSLHGSVPAQTANTVVGTENLIKESLRVKIKRFILCSSFGVIQTADLPQGGLVDETTPTEQYPELRDPYSFCKLEQEKLAYHYYDNHNLPLVVIRPGVIFGPPNSLLSPRIGLNIFGRFFHLGNNNKIPLTYYKNCADVFTASSTVEGIEGECFCISDDDLPTSRQLLKLYKKNVPNIRSISIPYSLLKLIAKLNLTYSNKTHNHLPPIFTPYKISTLWKGHTYNNRKAKTILGWTPKISMTDAINISLQYEITVSNSKPHQ